MKGDVMRAVLPWTFAAALVAVLPASVQAQDPAPSPSQPPPGATSQTPPPPPTTTTTSTKSTTDNNNGGSGWFNATQSHWTAAGFVGANYGASTASSSVDFGGQVGYLYRGIIGGEFLADFAPNFNMTNAFLADRPNVNAYMANAVIAAPLGSQGQIQPYVSAGFGGVQLRSNMLAVASVPTSAQTEANQTRGGGDVGFGVMGFAGNVGIRADVRYFRAFTNNTVTTTGNTAADVFAQNLLSGLDFWRANVGIAIRW
jgi:hypothetical protein